MTENPPPGPEDYFGIRIAPGESLADRFPQVAVRARMYKLEDDGASDLARRKRAAKDRGPDVVARHAQAIAAIEKRQRGETALDPVSPKIAEIRIESHRRAIRRYKAGLDVIPAVNVVAPVARRVAREDRRHARRPKPTPSPKGTNREHRNDHYNRPCDQPKPRHHYRHHHHCCRSRAGCCDWRYHYSVA
ncbi:hypothetical protein [Arthrobacter sp. NicSoilB8]|jgi:hypothetical protein|uniref:hypothetical protein n=1 Tax=Arthrobacter sp. NicSoilB8 TaxID=2830998 RepID=UPI001CC4E67F|nr:hypothetical protein [Arthrobacter sp. NicSoilB8]BCW71878.1 hypothetical protein NicSoilB8_29220 [Arthrobacter sp. NicSoilB8]